MWADALFFFDGRPCELSLYERFRDRVLSRFPDARIQAKKTQISFYDGHMFACVSLTPVRRKAERPEHFITVTFGLDHPLEDPRTLPVKVRENRWTHHIIIGELSEIDDQLMEWIAASHSQKPSPLGEGGSPKARRMRFVSPNPKE